MLDLLALALLIVWGLGIALQLFALVVVHKDENHELHSKLHGMIDQAGPGVVVSLLTVLVLFWPATLVYNVIQKNGK